jgi:hypothetical protein
MNRDDELIAQLEDYLESFEGVIPLPARVRNSVHADLPRTRQVRPDRGWGRITDMVTQASTRARWGIAAAVVVAAVVLGGAVFSSGRAAPGVGAAPPTASPSTDASQAPASPSPDALPSGPGSIVNAPLEACHPGGSPACIVPGTYRLAVALPGDLTLDVPAGWFSFQPAPASDGLLVDSGPDAPDGSGWGVVFMTVGAVPIDPCDPAKGTFDGAQTSTVDGLVTAMTSWPGFDATTPTAIEVDGVSGQQIELTSTRTETDCPDASIWSTAGGLPIDGYPMVNAQGNPRPGQFKILDVDGQLLVIRTPAFTDTSPFEESQGVAPDPDRHAADLVELNAMLDSITFSRAQP